MDVEAVESIVDEGRQFAQPGDIGVVLDVRTSELGVREVLVLFPNAPEATTCFLGVDVKVKLPFDTSNQAE
ncbi:hypothetical protein [Myxococcus fulvus]|uniref:hypothetical protein n=1 Tax=Myxococcus fulvus TaxID=33 RepID=UPI0020BDCA14|nr:hypothetical protein [Myxococcus fulvus]MCK8501741.1 hypothetical protein [Myxococcus fulvus]